VNRGFAAIAAAAATWPCAHAAEWRASSSVNTAVVNESNPRLELASVNDQQAIAANLGVHLERQTERVSVALDSSAARRQYREDRSLDRTDLRADLSLQYAATERLTWSASASATRDTTLTSELGISGETQAGYRHESLGAQLQPQWRLSERWTTSMQLQMQRNYYPSADSGLTDYQYQSAGLVASWRRTRHDSLGIVVRTGQSTVAGAPADIKDASASLQYTLAFAERWNLRLAGGPAWTRRTGSKQHSENFNLELTRGAQYGAVSLSVDRSLAPNGRGSLTRRDSLSLQMSRDMSAQLTGSLSARYLRSSNIVGALASSFEDVRYRRAEAGLNWMLSPQWSTVLNAGYSDQRQGASGTGASGVDLALGVRWSGVNHVF
jgi:hypothetical protein